MKITRGRIPCAKKVVVYGPEGIGKSTFASQFPDPVFIDTEGSTNNMDIARLPAPTSWSMLLEEVRYIMQNPSVCKTLVIDTADWAEQLCSDAICSKYQKSGIEDFGYGKGYVFLQEEFGRLLNLLSDLVEQKKIHVVLTAHAKMRKFEQPDEMGAYDRWEMKLSKNVAPIVKEWSDMVLFANYKTHVVKVDGKNKAQGGQRVMYTTHHSCWDAKNRYGLPDELPFAYEAIAGSLEESKLENRASTVQKSPQIKETALPPEESVKPESPAEAANPAPAENSVQVECPLELPGSSTSPGDAPPYEEPDPRIPKPLRDLMIANHVDEWEIQNVVQARGYIPSDVPIRDYEKVNPGFLEGCLVGAWDQVYGMIKQARENMEIPFN